ncbi:unnamed protein product [Cuscuta campestris]|uniref:Uncharacterized protein n=1 Tax=Cuscuta campestris TaxID=132261 RepID=A0A484M7Q4_9ASTE|nr:unnamed protein product [Cuscuta campestris]
MELVLAAIVDEHENKENFPPRSAEKFVPRQSKDIVFKKKKKNARKPLRDITHLFVNAPTAGPISDSQFNFRLLLPHPDASSNARSKRNASHEDEIRIHHSLRQNPAMVLRKHFR